jgi:hypothetical protein
MVSIMPGMDSRAPERTEKSSGILLAAENLPCCFSTALTAALTSAARLEGYFPAGLREVRAHFRGDGEAGRNGETDSGHFGKIGTLATKEVLHLGVPVCYLAKGVYGLFCDSFLGGGFGLPWFLFAGFCWHGCS